MVTFNLQSDKSYSQQNPVSDHIFFLNYSNYTVLRIQIRIGKNMRIHGTGSKWQNINQKLQKKFFLLSKPESEILKKVSIKISWFLILNGSSSFSIKIERKIWKFSLLKKFSKHYNNLDPDLDPFFPMRIQEPDPH